MTKDSNRKFGFLVGSIFLLYGSVFGFRHGYQHLPGYLGVSTGVLLILLGWLKPYCLGPVYRIWMKAGKTIGKINSVIILGLVFYFILFPISAMQKLFSKQRKFLFKQNQSSYWIEKNSIDPIVVSMKQPF